jgi:hypothetical protein
MTETFKLLEKALADGENAIGELFTFVTFCEASMNLSPFTAKAPELARDMTKRSGVTWGDDALHGMELYADAIKRGISDLRGLTSYLHSLAYIRVCTALEVVVDAVLVSVLTDTDHWDRLPVVSGLKVGKVDIVSLLRSSADQQVRFVAEEIKKGIGASLKSGIGRFESVLDAVGMSGPVPSEVRDSILQLVEVRNAVVHRDGVADSRLVNKVPGLGFKEGEKIQISRIEFAIVSTASIWYILELRRRADSMFPGAENPHGEGFSKEILEDLRRYIVKRAASSAETENDALPQQLS